MADPDCAFASTGLTISTACQSTIFNFTREFGWVPVELIWYTVRKKLHFVHVERGRNVNQVALSQCA